MQEMMLMKDMTDQQKMMFMSEMNKYRKSTSTSILLALFLGGFGAHHFYLNSLGMGFLYLVFCWSFIPMILALIECFFLSGRVSQYNENKAMEIAAKVKVAFT